MLSKILGKSILKIESLSNDLVGKLAGPVGSYNGPSMIVKDPEELEKTYVEFLGLKPSEYSNQLVEPENVLRLLLEMNVAFGIIANFATCSVQKSAKFLNIFLQLKSVLLQCRKNEIHGTVNM